ncbi:hypothetical protein CEUSTIGMA_g2908.t1 [Chlamydomonas eustigma]|uniref:Uncharacterized protein n=1 Tax=Chlamydomonas eustigma TaxID=1157962 RepID=A0A250WXE9_9CHLO|nr:hypothetical protein CEUSTIGMA_g2908.t1 [Chlamydomonas eustigma]|eukprot:GAX75465.1 hypothetical protein CEUSTIGMA_g2908.t1 [Chlamydomonas eustigma]
MLLHKRTSLLLNPLSQRKCGCLLPHCTNQFKRIIDIAYFQCCLNIQIENYDSSRVHPAPATVSQTATTYPYVSQEEASPSPRVSGSVTWDAKPLAASLLLALGILLEYYGLEGLLDIYLGDSVFGAICCILVGVTLMVGVRVSGAKTLFGENERKL